MRIFLGKPRHAIRCFERALNGDLKAYGPEHLDVVAKDWNNLGRAWVSLEQHRKAVRYYKKALGVFEKRLGKDYPLTKITKEHFQAAENGVCRTT